MLLGEKKGCEIWSAVSKGKWKEWGSIRRLIVMALSRTRTSNGPEALKLLIVKEITIQLTAAEEASDKCARKNVDVTLPESFQVSSRRYRTWFEA